MAFSKLNSMKFVGLDGLKHFWTKAKTWIAKQITAEVTAKIAEIVANAPEDLDTLKEIADWISAHANNAAAMNTQINTNKSDISALKTSIAGKADTGHKHAAEDITSGKKLILQGDTVNSNLYTDTNPKIEFKNRDGSQNVSLIFTDYDAVQEPASLTLNGNQGNEYFIAPNIKATGNFYGNLSGKADTAGTADRARNMYYQNLDLSALDKTKFYPAFCYSSIDFAEVAICSEGGMGSMEYNQNRIHFDISTQGWSDLLPTLNIREYGCYENNEVTIGCIGRGLKEGGWAIWLRGGLTYNCYTRNCELSLKTSDYTFGDEVYTVGTNYYGGPNTNVKIEFTPQSTIIEGAYNNRIITAPAFKATINFIGNLTGNSATATTANSANKISPNYAKRVDLTTVTSNTIKYIKVADCTWDQTGTLQVLLEGDAFQDTLVINFGGGHATHPMLCGYCISHRYYVASVIAQKGSNYNSSYSIYVKIEQLTSCTVKVALLKGDCTINITESTTAPTNISEWAVSDGFFGTLTGNASTAGTADKAVEVVDYRDSSRTIRIGYEGPGITADKLLHLAGYTRDNSSPSVKLKDVNKEEIIKWLGIPRIKYADYTTPTQTFTQFQQEPIELSKFSPEVTPNNVLCFMVTYWTGAQLIASADWGNTVSSGLKCALIALQAGTGNATIRCVYMV